MSHDERDTLHGLTRRRVTQGLAAGAATLAAPSVLRAQTGPVRVALLDVAGNVAGLRQRFAQGGERLRQLIGGLGIDLDPCLAALLLTGCASASKHASLSTNSVCAA